MSVLQQPVSESVQPGDSHCAVASCGEILFGNGTKLDIKGLGVAFTLIIVLVCIIYKMNKTTCVQCRGLVSQTRGPAVTRSDAGSCVYNLPKRNLSLSDAGTYYCAVASCGEILFGNGTKLDIHKYDFPLTPTALALVTSNIVFNQDSDVVNYAAVSFTAKKSSSSRTARAKTSREDAEYSESCVYNLPKRNLNLSDAGTYYCAVASCGVILFGNGTKLDIQVPEHDSPFDLSPTVLALVVSNIVLGIVTLLLVWVLCKTQNRDSRDSDVLNYAAVSFTPKKNSSSSRRAREKTSREDAVYSEVRYLQQQ
ncbi:unnamed protein product [Coregonus sp. 'balchen']|nr:unnamed protein product [Coregonus sp. 'balchen']